MKPVDERLKTPNTWKMRENKTRKVFVLSSTKEQHRNDMSSLLNVVLMLSVSMCLYLTDREEKKIPGKRAPFFQKTMQLSKEFLLSFFSKKDDYDYNIL